MVNMKSKCCQQEQSGELKVKVVKADGVEGTRCNVEVTDFEKLDQKLDIMLGDTEIKPKKVEYLYRRLRISLALAIMKTAIKVANWLRL